MFEILKSFIRLGSLGFGGPIAVMGMMEQEFCAQRNWLSREQFFEVYALLKMMPGPISTQMAIYLGHIRRGRLGGILAGIAFILPSFLMILFLSYWYLQAGKKYEAWSGFFSGLQSGALVVILLSVVQLSRPYYSRLNAWILASIAGVLIFLHPASEPGVIFSLGIIGAWVALRKGSRKVKRQRNRPSRLHGFLFGGIPFFVKDQILQNQLFQIFWIFFKAGAFVFGTGLAIVPMLEADTVSRFHWLTHAQFMDGLAMGQVTPGPIVITATFIGYQAAGFLGALIATVGMFMPSFINVLWILPRLWGRFRGTLGAQGFVAWAIPAVIGGIVAATFRLGVVIFSASLPSLVIFIIALGLALRFKPPAWALIPVAGGAGVVIQWMWGN